MLCILHINSIGIRVLYLITDCPAFIFVRPNHVNRMVLSFSVLIIFRVYEFLFNKYLFLGLNKSTIFNLIKYILFSYPHFIHEESKDQEV